MVKQCSVCNKTFSVYKSLVKTNDQLTCEKCAKNKRMQDEHDRQLESDRQSEEMREAEHRRGMELDQQRHRQELEQSKAMREAEHRRELEVVQQRHRQELEQKEHETLMEIKVRSQLDAEKENQTRLEITKKDILHQRELKMEEVVLHKKEAEARIAEAKAKEAEAGANVEIAKARAREAEAGANVEIAKLKEREKVAEFQSILWKNYFDPETNADDKLLIMEEIRKLTLSDNQKSKKAVKEVKVKSKIPQGACYSRQQRPWTACTSKLPKPSK